MRREKWSTRKDIHTHIYEQSPDKGFFCGGIGHLKADKGASIRTRSSGLEFGHSILFIFLRNAKYATPTLSYPIPSSPVRYGLNSVPAENSGVSKVSWKRDVEKIGAPSHRARGVSRWFPCWSLKNGLRLLLQGMCSYLSSPFLLFNLSCTRDFSQKRLSLW